MIIGPELLLVGAVAAVGVLHTIVPDHWVPITLIARQQAWSKGETARASLQAATGHVVSTLLIASVVWLAGVAFAERFGQIVNTVSSLALIAFGGWIAISAWRELHGRHGHGHSHTFPHRHENEHGHDHGAHRHHAHAHHDHDDHDDHHDHDDGPAAAPSDDPLYAPSRGETALLTRHVHAHRHGSVHAHWHDHTRDSSHPVTPDIETAPPAHAHRHKTNVRTALLLILGSSPMIEGIPAFFAAGQYGVGLIVVMALVFAVSTIATYVVLCVYSTAGLQRVRLGAFERYGEVLSGAFIAAIGAAFWIWPLA
jgi:ABC-type nickel/cobalt efflux system permease component RcnA